MASIFLKLWIFRVASHTRDLKWSRQLIFFFIPECFIKWFRDDSDIKMAAVLFHELK